MTAVNIFSIVTDKEEKQGGDAILDNLPLSCPMPKDAFILASGRTLLTIGPYLQNISYPDTSINIDQVLQVVYESDSYLQNIRQTEWPPAWDVVNLVFVGGQCRDMLNNFFEPQAIDFSGKGGGTKLRGIQPTDIDALLALPEWSHVNVIIFRWLTGIPACPSMTLAAVRWRAMKMLKASYPYAIRIPTTGELLPVYRRGATNHVDPVS